MKCAIPLKGGDTGRFRNEYFALIWGAIEKVSPISGKNHEREDTEERMNSAVERFFDSSCRRVVIECDPSRKLEREGRRIRSHDNIL